MNNKIKLLIIALVITIPILIPVIIGVNPVSGILSSGNTDAAATYKAQCAVCHGPAAAKLFDPAKPDEEHIEVILKGKKGEKPPFMPGFEAKGMTAEQAKDLVDHMRNLRKDAEKKADAKEEAKEETEEKSREAIIGMYKTSCVACHGAKADKLYDPKIDLDEQTRIILKGKKGEKPPYMPAYESKGITEKQAKALATYMIELRTPNN